MAPGFRLANLHTFCSVVALPSCLGSPFRPLCAWETDSTGPPETEGGTLQDLHPYEVMVVLDPEADEARQEDVIARIRQIVEAAGGQLEAADSLGRQRLAYEILKRTEAFRWVVTLTAPPSAVEEVDRVLRIHDDVLRHMIVRRTGRSTGPVEETVPVS
jgi:small subunit ribosomal protein S6